MITKVFNTQRIKSFRENIKLSLGKGCLNFGHKEFYKEVEK